MEPGSRNRDNWSLYVVFAVVLVLASAAVVTPARADGEAVAHIVAVNDTGEAVVASSNGTTYLWQTESYAANVTFRVDAPEDKYSVCVYPDESASNEFDCQSKDIGNGTTTTALLDVGNASATGERSLYFEVVPTFGNDETPLANRTVTQYVMSKDGDLDDDGLTNEKEVNLSEKPGWPKDAFDDPDIDNDGLEDGREVNYMDSSPTNADTDNDGLPDGAEVQYGTDPTDSDTDGDGISDWKEVRELGSDPLDPSSPESTGETGTDSLTDPVTPDSNDQFALFFLLGVGVLGATALLWHAGWGQDGLGAALRSSETTETSTDEATGTAQGAGEADGDGTGVSGPTSAADAARDEPLTDEGQVKHLLSKNGGRMKQADIVDETGWSKSKVSRLLSRMEERDELNRLRVGRGNIVYLDGAKPSGVDPGDDSPR
ncbi:helix-turn-helix transcriptional regulator [Halomicrococcus gelatinilyticus]|uniref:helix-turn-helix transcriptional regulator n=1 Tax=Halomicrococcus gelatinilyticus TaxID=1702103 RepID=UPI002E14615D